MIIEIESAAAATPKVTFFLFFAPDENKNTQVGLFLDSSQYKSIHEKVNRCDGRVALRQRGIR